MTANPYVYTPSNMARGFKMYLYWSGQRRALAENNLRLYNIYKTNRCPALMHNAPATNTYAFKLEGDKLRAMARHCEERANWWRRWLLELNNG